MDKQPDDWREIRNKQPESLPGQLGLFGEEIKTRRGCGRREFKDRRRGQTFLFDGKDEEE